METTEIVETETDLSTGKIVVICVAALAVGAGAKLLVDGIKSKLADRKATKTITVVDETN